MPSLRLFPRILLALTAGIALPLVHAATHAAPAAAPPAPAVAAPGSVLAQVQALRKDDPAAAFALGLPAWEAAADKQAVADLGLELVEIASARRQQDEVVRIGSVLRTRARLDPQQRLRLLKRLNGDIWVTRDAARIGELETELAALEPALPGQADAIAELWRMLGASYFLVQDADNADRVARIALSKVPASPHLVEYNANQIVFTVAAQRGRMPEAIEALLEVERIGKALGRPVDPALLHNATGVFAYARDWDRAIDYGTRALAAWDANPHPRLPRTSVLNNLASAYEGAGQLERARALYEEALAAERAGNGPSATTLNNLANILRRTGRPHAALPLLSDAAALLEADGENGEAAIIHSNIGAAQADLGRHADAAASFARAYALFKLTDNLPRRLELYPRMIASLEALGRHREALEWMREYKQASDEMVNVESNTRIAELESAVDLARREGEVAQLERDRAAQDAAVVALRAGAQRQRLVAYGMGVGLLLLGALALLKIRESRERKRLNQELERRHAEIQAQHHDLEKLAATVRRQSEEDALTGLRNRRYVRTWLDQLGARHAQSLAAGVVPAPVLVALLDMDHFKRVNDVHGHEAGDHALMHVGDILRACSRGSDVIARWGGEEFLWICPDTPLAEAGALFRRVREQLQAQPLARPGGSVPLTVSMGATLFPLWPQRAGDWALSLRVADAALYEAKRGGRDRWVGFAPGTPDADACGPGTDVPALEAAGCLLRIGQVPAPLAGPLPAA